MTLAIPQNIPGNPRSPGNTLLARTRDGAGISAQTVVPSSSQRVPQCRDSLATMRNPLPPVVNFPESPSSGRVGPPPSCTEIRTAPAPICQATLIVAPGSGRACRSALLNNSLMTTAASLTAGS